MTEAFSNLSSSPRRLQELEEARGRLMRVFEAESFAVAVYAFVMVVLPLDQFDSLQALMGRKIAILRTESGYRVRTLEAQ